MQDQPNTIELVGVVRDFLQNVAMPKLKARDAFHARVAANALGIVYRELQNAPQDNAEEVERLRELLHSDGSLQDLNRELCRRIRAGEVTLETPGFTEHLWQTTLTKLAIDQPKYTAYRTAIDKNV